MRKAISFGACAFACWFAQPAPLSACGGLFCGQPQPLQQQEPVDQRAERILFRVKDNAVTMVVQIAYAGQAPDFAWVLPLGQVPDAQSLAVFPQRGLNVLDQLTAPRFIMPICSPPPQANAPVAAGAALPMGTSMAAVAAEPPKVTVHFQEEVGPYDVAAVESEDPMALFQWLRDNKYNVNESMLPYIRTYTADGMKFLALKLKKGKDTSDIQPLRFDLPGSTPSIPLRMTGLAAEPEMSILTFVAADRRYDGANWPSIDIADDQIAWRVGRTGLETNWESLLARSVDEAGGQGWVTEFASSNEAMVKSLTFTTYSTTEEMNAVDDLLDVIESAPYLTRLHTRLSAEEMTIDPSFRQVKAKDVSATHQLSRNVDGVDLCPGASTPDPCAFTTCGAGGLCRPVAVNGQMVAACACVDGATARTTIVPPSDASGAAEASTSVACQDIRMSFSNPSPTKDGVTVVDPCLSFDCGKNGDCVPINMTPTCICKHGFVAVGGIASDGTRTTTCQKPMGSVPNAFYSQRLPDLPADLPGGRTVDVKADLPVVSPKATDLSAVAVPTAPAGNGEQSGTSGNASNTRPIGGAPRPIDGVDAGAASEHHEVHGGLCSVGSDGLARGGRLPGAVLLAAAAIFARIRRSRTRHG